MRPKSSAALMALQAWRRVYATHRNAHSVAVQYHSAQLGYKILLAWRVQLRARYKMIKRARTAYKFFIARKAWMIWTDRFKELRREKKLKELESQKVKKAFDGQCYQSVARGCLFDGARSVGRSCAATTAANDCRAGGRCKSCACELVSADVIVHARYSHLSALAAHQNFGLEPLDKPHHRSEAQRARHGPAI
jgi:hypothetical protein